MYDEKRVIIYGTGRFQMDFQSIFDNIRVEYYISDDSENLEIFGKQVKNPDCLAMENKNNLLIIVCEFDYEEKKRMLLWNGLTEDQIIYAEDLFPMLDVFHKDIDHEEIVIWGSGNVCREFLYNYQRVWGNEPNVIAFIDSDIQKDNTTFMGKPVIHSKRWLDERKAGEFVVVASIYYEEIRQNLMDAGMVEHEDFEYFINAWSRPSRMLSKVIRTPSRRGSKCWQPFYQYGEVGIYGLSPCCTTRATLLPMGDIMLQSLDEAWTGIVAKIYRLSLINQSYAFCDLSSCANWMANEEGFRSYTGEDLIPTDAPAELQFAIDDTCNLHCMMCRDKVRAANEAGRKVRRALVDRIADTEVVAKAEVLTVAGAGEVFATHVYDSLLYNKKADQKRNEIAIRTNLMLFDREKWDKLRKVYKKISFHVSMDAAEKELFESIRRGSDWERFLENLSFLSELRRQGGVSFVNIDMVVQKCNIHQIIPVMRLVCQYGFDRLTLCNVLNWDLFEEDYFRNNVAVTLQDGKTFIPGVGEILYSKEYAELSQKIEVRGSTVQLRDLEENRKAMNGNA